jgi:PhoD-like phosphatase
VPWPRFCGALSHEALNRKARAPAALYGRQSEGLEAAPHPPRIGTRRRFLTDSLAVIAGAALAHRAAADPLSPMPDTAAATVGEGLVASVRATGPARIKLRAWPSANPSAIVESPWYSTNGANAAEIALTKAATPQTAWSWQGIVQEPRGKGSPVADVVRTLPARPAPGTPSSFTFAFGSCATLGGTVPSLRVARGLGPLFFAMIGDMGYPDKLASSQDYNGYVSLFRSFLAHPDAVPLLASTPLYCMQDDHDYGVDDCWADTVQEFAGLAYADLMPGVAWPDPNYRRWSIGEAEFFLLDNRRYKDNPAGPYENGKYVSVIRSTQRKWLLDGLSASRARVKFVFTPMTWTWYWGSGERNEVLTSINNTVSGPVIFLSGDRHAGAFARFPNRVWELLACPLKNSVKATTPTRTGVIWTENGTGVGLYNVLGVVDVDTRLAQRVTLRLVREDGVELHREVVDLTL